MKYILEYKKEDLYPEETKTIMKKTIFAAEQSIRELVYQLKYDTDKKISTADFFKLIQWIKFGDTYYPQGATGARFEQSQFYPIVNYMIKKDWVKPIRSKNTGKNVVQFQILQPAIEYMKDWIKNDSMKIDNILYLLKFYYQLGYLQSLERYFNIMKKYVKGQPNSTADDKMQEIIDSVIKKDLRVLTKFRTYKFLEPYMKKWDHLTPETGFFLD